MQGSLFLRAPSENLEDLRLHLPLLHLMQKTSLLRRSAESLNRRRPQASPNFASLNTRRLSQYISDEEMHWTTSTEEDDSDAEDSLTRSIPSSAAFFRTIRFNEVTRHAQVNKDPSSSTLRVLHPNLPSVSKGVNKRAPVVKLRHLSAIGDYRQMQRP